MENEFDSWAGFVEAMKQVAWLMAYTIGSVGIFLGAVGLAGGAVVAGIKIWKWYRI